MFATGLLVGRCVRVSDLAAMIPKVNPPSANLPEEALTSSSPSEPASYLIRAGSFPSMTEAERFVVHLKERGFEQAFTRPRLTPEAGSVVEVLLGPFEDIEVADRTLRELRNNGVSDLRIIPNR